MIEKTILITGTHHTPAIELIRQLQQDPKYHWHIHYISHLYPTETHIKNSIIPKIGDNFHSISGGKFHRESILKTLVDIPKTISAIFQAFFLVKKIHPNIIVSFGGYASVPVVFSGFLNHIPSVTHEQTLTTSLSTKINHLFTTKTALSFPNPDVSSKKAVITGNLIREDIFKIVDNQYSHIKKPFIYITGGNQGSEAINQVVYELLPKLTKEFSIIHQTGNHQIKPFVSPRYFPTPYTTATEIGFILQKAEIVISRSGANICHEIATFSKKCILIPHPKTQQNEQILNAKWLKDQSPKSTIIIPQSKLTEKTLLQAITHLVALKNKKTQILPKPNLKLLHLIHQIVC